MKRILVVDDDRRFLHAVAQELLRHGYGVEEASDGLEGLQKALQEPPDVAVIDLVMPKVGGSELISFFRENAYLATVPVILLSGVLIESGTLVEELGVDFVLPKGPFEQTMSRLLESLRELESGSRGPRPLVNAPGIHERRQVVELLNIKRDLASVLEGAAAGILELDPRGRVSYANAEAEELLGIGRASLMGTDILSVLPKTCLAVFQPVLARFEGDSGPARRALALAIERRALRAVLTSVWSDGARQSIVVTLQELAQDAEIQNRPGQLLRYLSHEMRSSLLMIEGGLRTLARGSVAAPADRDAQLSFLAQETARLQRLLGDAAKFHRTLRDLPAMEMGPIDLVSVIKDSISGVTALAVPRGIEVTYRGPNAHPRVRGNHDKLLQVLYNLLLNALKATPRGGSLTIELGTTEHEVSISVNDTGRGMSQDELGEIMAQAQRPELFLSQKGKRVGLGLAIAFQFVRAHRGRFFGESRIGWGSRFTFTLPLDSEVDGQRQFPRSSAERRHFEDVEEETT